jgi:hypothetical protein
MGFFQWPSVLTESILTDSKGFSMNSRTYCKTMFSFSVAWIKNDKSIDEYNFEEEGE